MTDKQPASTVFLITRVKPEVKADFLEKCLERDVEASAAMREAVDEWMQKA